MKFNRIHAFAAIGLMALAYQNCAMEGFGVLQQNQVNLANSNVPSTISATDSSELELMLEIFGRRHSTSSSTASNVCQLSDQATLPLVTHYPRIGDKEQPVIRESGAETKYASGKEFVSQYDLTRFPLPVIGNFIGDSFDLVSLSPSEANQARFENLLRQLCIGGLSSVRFIQGAHEVRTPGDLADLLVENAPYFQILHSLVFKNNLFTVIVPPQWTRSTSSSLPTLFNGFYDLNVNFMSLEGESMIETLAQAYLATGKSGFGILWNGAGAVGSRTFDNTAYLELNQFLRIYLSDLGAANNKLITFGASRGGVTSLNVASHPAITAASVAFAYASVPPNELSTIANLVTPTVPALLHASDWSVGFIGSWQNSFRHPGRTTRTGFQGLSGIESHLKVLTGASSAAEVSREFNALTTTKIAKLIRNRTAIFIEAGSHDFIVPSTDQFRFFIDGIAAGIRMEARVNYLLGHQHSNEARRAKLASVFNTLINQAPIGASFVSVGQISRFVASPNGELSALPPGTVPLTVELPRYIVDESDPMILATGPANGRYMLAFRKGTELLKINLELDGKGLLNLRLPHSHFTAGDYELYGAYTVDRGSRPTEKVTITSLATRGLIMSRVLGDIRPYVANASGAVLDGIYAQGRYFNAGVGTGANYGFLQSGIAAISNSERAIISPPVPTPTPTPVPALFSCGVTNSNLASFTMSGTIKPSGTDAGKLGFYFVAGYDVTRKEWWSFDGVSWAKHNGTNASYLPISGPTAAPLSGTGITGAIFTNADLRSFPNGEIFLGYGVGSTTAVAWSNLIDNSKYKLCATLPNK